MIYLLQINKRKMDFEYSFIANHLGNNSVYDIKTYIKNNPLVNFNNLQNGKKIIP